MSLWYDWTSPSLSVSLMLYAWGRIHSFWWGMWLGAGVQCYMLLEFHESGNPVCQHVLLLNWWQREVVWLHTANKHRETTRPVSCRYSDNSLPFVNLSLSSILYLYTLLPFLSCSSAVCASCVPTSGVSSSSTCYCSTPCCLGQTLLRSTCCSQRRGSTLMAWLLM